MYVMYPAYQALSKKNGVCEVEVYGWQLVSSPCPKCRVPLSNSKPWFQQNKASQGNPRKKKPTTVHTLLRYAGVLMALAHRDMGTRWKIEQGRGAVV
jgi:hypothetical protein